MNGIRVAYGRKINGKTRVFWGKRFDKKGKDSLWEEQKGTLVKREELSPGTEGV